MNEKFKSSNLILNTLNVKYWVYKRGVFSHVKKVDNTFDIYYRPEGGGLDYWFTIIAKPTMKKSVIFNDKSYTNIDTLLGDVEIFNKSLMFPSRCYDPMYMDWAREETKISWYLRKLGMKLDGGGYSLKDVMGKEVIHLNFEMNYNNRWGGDYKERKDSTAGYILRSYGDSGWINLDFDNAEDAVAKINSLLSTQLITDINTDFDVLSKITGTFDSLKNANIESIELMLKGQKIKYRDKVLPILKQLVEAFESE